MTHSHLRLNCRILVCSYAPSLTISLFPEGGGQPSDRGTVGGVNVLYVGRDNNGNVIHQLSAAVPIGEQVLVKLDWNRRFDHMQQHSGQHLLSAVAHRLFGWDTKSWWLSAVGECALELETKAITQEQINQIEDECNLIIRNSSPVNVRVFENSEAASADQSASLARKIPDGVDKDLRVVEIDGIDVC
jgi:misacylated tRNA(Ala) deacylase